MYSKTSDLNSTNWSATVVEGKILNTKLVGGVSCTWVGTHPPIGVDAIDRGVRFYDINSRFALDPESKPSGLKRKALSPWER